MEYVWVANCNDHGGDGTDGRLRLDGSGVAPIRKSG